MQGYIHIFHFAQDMLEDIDLSHRLRYEQLSSFGCFHLLPAETHLLFQRSILFLFSLV